MFSYEYSEEERDRARQHATYQVEERDGYADAEERSELIKAKQIGGLGEIAFNEFCRLFIPPELWEWQHREALEDRVGEVTEHDPYDFEVFGKRVDVKTTQGPLGIRADLKWWRDAHKAGPKSEFEFPDIYVLCLIRLKQDHTVIVGWARQQDLEYREVTSQNLSADWLKRSREIPSGRATYIPTRPLHDLLQLGPPEMQMFRPE